MTVTLQEIADRLAVGDLLTGYPTALDTRDRGALSDVFTPDAEGDGGADHFLLGGSYRDLVVRTPQGWRIAHRTLTRLWSTGDPAVVLRPVPVL